MSATVMTTMGCAWKYMRKLLAAQTSARTSFSIEASQLPIEDLDLFDCPWGWELQHGLRLAWARFYPFRTDHVPTNLSVKGLVYQSLVCDANVLEAKRHFCVAIYPVIGVESCLILILFHHLYLMIAFVGVQNTLKGIAAEGLDLPIDFWKGVTILRTGLV
ncbi:hypothetical protein Tco_0399806 [Tanacetum coccineum]